MLQDKKLKSVAEAVAKIMNEELKGKQHKIDANKNKKIDAEDFKILRGQKKVKEEVEQIDEVKLSDLPVRKVSGKAYGGAAQKDEPEKDDDDMNDKPKAVKKGTFKRRYNTKAYKESFTGMITNLQEQGLGYVAELMVVEEPTNDEYTAEVKDAQAKSEGKGKKADVAAASVQSVKNEEVEQINEIPVPVIAALGATAGRALASSAGRNIGGSVGKAVASDTGKQVAGRVGSHVATSIADKTNKDDKDEMNNEAVRGVYHGEKGLRPPKNQAERNQLAADIKQNRASNRADQTTTGYSDRVTPKSGAASGRSHNATVLKTKVHGGEETAQNFQSRNIDPRHTGYKGDLKLPAGAGKGMKEEVEQVEERHLTEPEMKKREEVVKSMKKKMGEFRKRYGSRAKEVMYATATTVAKKK